MTLQTAPQGATDKQTLLEFEQRRAKLLASLDAAIAQVNAASDALGNLHTAYREFLNASNLPSPFMMNDGQLYSIHNPVINRVEVRTIRLAPFLQPETLL